jgi:hypothetical protein
MLAQFAARSWSVEFRLGLGFGFERKSRATNNRFQGVLVPLDPTAGGSPPTSMHPGPAHLAANAAGIRPG